MPTETDRQRQLEEAKEVAQSRPRPREDEGVKTEPKHVEAATMPFLGSSN